MRSVARLVVALALVAVASLFPAGVALAAPGSAARAQVAALPDGGDGWSVSLVASASAVFDGESVTFTATTNADVGPTPWFITIEDISIPGPVEECASGTTCSTTVSFDTPTTQVFEAFVGDLPQPLSLPGLILASSQTISVEWQLRVVICPTC
jgi:hypothetical protein